MLILKFYSHKMIQKLHWCHIDQTRGLMCRKVDVIYRKVAGLIEFNSIFVHRESTQLRHSLQASFYDILGFTIALEIFSTNYTTLTFSDASKWPISAEKIPTPNTYITVKETFDDKHINTDIHKRWFIKKADEIAWIECCKVTKRDAVLLTSKLFMITRHNTKKMLNCYRKIIHENWY